MEIGLRQSAIALRLPHATDLKSLQHQRQFRFGECARAAQDNVWPLPFTPQTGKLIDVW